MDVEKVKNIKYLGIIIDNKLKENTLIKIHEIENDMTPQYLKKNNANNTKLSTIIQEKKII